MRRLQQLSLRSVVLALAIAELAGCDRSGRPVVVGVAGPFTTAYGASMRQGAELAAREVNANGGIGSRPLELRFVDDGADPDSALRVAQRLHDAPEVVAVVGHVNSGAMLNAAAAYERGLPAVATSATSGLISRLGDWVFRVAPSDSANSVELARVAREIDRPVAVLYENEDYGRGLADGFRGALAGSGGRVLTIDPYLPTTADFRPYLERMRQQGAGVVFIAGLETDAARIIDQAREIGLEARFLGGDGMEGLTGMGAAYEGTLVGVLFHPDASPLATAFAAQFREAFGREPDSFAALGYDATRLIAEAARAAGADRASIREHLAGVGRDGRPAYQGVTGTIRFDENGDPVDKQFSVGAVRGGRIVLGEES
jgi:branched-chain amino acid transport system substrate-binding protein